MVKNSGFTAAKQFFQHYFCFRFRLRMLLAAILQTQQFQGCHFGKQELAIDEWFGRLLHRLVR